MLIMHIDRVNNVAVFTVIPSPNRIQLMIAKLTIPVAKPKNLPGHSKPSKCINACLVASIKMYEISVPLSTESSSGLLTNHSHLNCPLV